MFVDFSNIQDGRISIPVMPYSNLDWQNHNISVDPLFQIAKTEIINYYT